MEDIIRLIKLYVWGLQNGYFPEVRMGGLLMHSVRSHREENRPAVPPVALRTKCASGSNLRSRQNCCTSSAAFKGRIITTSPAANLNTDTKTSHTPNHKHHVFKLKTSQFLNSTTRFLTQCWTHWCQTRCASHPESGRRPLLSYWTAAWQERGGTGMVQPALCQSKASYQFSLSHHPRSGKHRLEGGCHTWQILSVSKHRCVISCR